MSRDIFITGLGFIGRFLANDFVAKGYNVTVLSRRLPDAELDARIVQLQHDIRFPLPDIAGLQGGFTIIHTASIHPNSGPASTPADFIDVNVTGAVHVSEWAKSRGCALVVNLSSISAYGAPREPLLIEDSPLYAPGIYGTSKYLAEQVFESYGRHFPTLSLRLPGILGRGCHPAWIAQVAAKARSGEAIEVYNPRSGFNNIAHVRELARLIQHVLALSPRPCGAVNVGAETPITVIDVVQTIVSGLNSSSPILEPDSTRSSFTISIKKLKDDLGFLPLTTLENLALFLADFSTP